VIYGRFSEAEQARRDHQYGPNYPFIESGGQLYRITELVQTMVGHANYQAVEADPRELEQWQEEHKPKPEPKPRYETPEPVLTPPEPPKEEIPEYVLPVLPAEESKPKPRLADYARVHYGYRGGSISNDIKAAYRAIYGDPPPISQRVKDRNAEYNRRSRERTAARKAAFLAEQQAKTQR
jgi:hypothetical protein